MWHGFEGVGWGWLVFGAVHMALFWGLVILAIVALAKWLGGGSEQSGSIRPIDILKARYAKGEISRDEFERMKRDLSEHWVSVDPDQVRLPGR